MSAQAVGAVWDRAPYTGGKLLVLLAVADVVNDTYNHRFWMTVGELAKKARVSPNTARAAVQQFVEDGWLEVVAESKGRTPNEYRFTPTLQSSEGSANPPIRVNPPISEPEPSNPGESTLQSDVPSPLSIPREPKGNPTRARRAFADTWEHYPRKLNRKGAEKAWTAQVRKGSDPDLMHIATVNYARIRFGQDPTTTMHGATFFGPNDRWADYVNPTPDAAVMPRPRESAQMSKARRALEAVARTDIERDAIALMVGEAS